MAKQVQRKKRKKGKNTTKNTAKKIGIITGAFAAVLVISILVLVLVLVHYIEKVNYVPIQEDYTILAETDTFIEDDITNPAETTAADSSDEEIDEYQQAVEEALANRGEEHYQMEEVYNILLIGSDERVIGGNARSDTMLLVSVNKKTKQIVGTSFLRDLYVKIPEVGFKKLNAAYAYGGELYHRF